MISDSWDKLLGLNTKALLSSDFPAALAGLDADVTIIEVYADDIEQAMFLRAAYTMADLLGITCFRLDIEDGMPQFVLSFGKDIEDARERMRRYYERMEEMADVGEHVPDQSCTKRRS